MYVAFYCMDDKIPMIIYHRRRRHSIKSSGGDLAFVLPFHQHELDYGEWRR